MSQKTIVKAKLLEEGRIDNFWAFKNYLLRLGAVIWELRQEGMKIQGASGKELGYDRSLYRNYYYWVEKEPTQKPLL